MPDRQERTVRRSNHHEGQVLVYHISAGLAVRVSINTNSSAGTVPEKGELLVFYISSKLTH